MCALLFELTAVHAQPAYLCEHYEVVLLLPRAEDGQCRIA